MISHTTHRKRTEDCRSHFMLSSGQIGIPFSLFSSGGDITLHLHKYEQYFCNADKNSPIIDNKCKIIPRLIIFLKISSFRLILYEIFVITTLADELLFFIVGFFTVLSSFLWFNMVFCLFSDFRLVNSKDSHTETWGKNMLIFHHLILDTNLCRRSEGRLRSCEQTTQHHSLSGPCLSSTHNIQKNR